MLICLIYNPNNCVSIKIEDLNMYPKLEELPVLFEEIFIKDTKENLTDNTELDNSYLEADASNYK